MNAPKLFKNRYALKEGKHADIWRNVRFPSWDTSAVLNLHLGHTNSDEIGAHRIKDFAVNDRHAYTFNDNYCPQFNGITGFVTIANHSSFEDLFKGKSWSLGMYIKPFSPADGVLFEMEDGTNVIRLSLKVDSDGLTELLFHVTDGTNVGEWDTLVATVPLYVWSRIWVVFNGDSSGANPRFYQDGAALPAGVVNSWEGGIATNSGAITLGGDSSFFLGEICDLCIVDSELTAAQIAQDSSYHNLSYTGFTCFYAMNETTAGPYANTGSGGAGNGTVTGGVSVSQSAFMLSPSFVAGRKGSLALDLPGGAKEFIAVAHNSDFDFTGGSPDDPFSIVVSAYLREASDCPLVVKGISGTSIEWKFDTNATDNLEMSIYSGGTNVIYIGRTSTATISQNAWVTLGITYSGAGASSGVKLYINGVEDTGSVNESGTYVGITDTDAPLSIGTYVSATEYMNGILGRVMIFDAEITAAKMLQLHNDCSRGF